MSGITIIDFLEQHVALQPQACALVCVDRSGETSWSYAALLEKVVHLAGYVQQQVKPGERALILMDSGIDYVCSFLACQYAGVVAIPSFPAESAKPQHLARTMAIAENAQATLLLTTRRFAETTAALCQQHPGRLMLLTDSLPTAIVPAEKFLARPDDIAFFQYTSGSTATPKGVMVSHGNLIANEKVITERMQTSKADVMISWLPLFHDMGLIGGLLQPLFVGYPLILTSPRYFMERPGRWLELMTRYQGTISGGPDFAFRLCLDRVKAEQKAQLDLRQWRVAFSGAEPIRHDTLQQFADAFASAGFQSEAFYPCYGLAEGTLMLTGSDACQGAVVTGFDSAKLAEGIAVPVCAEQLTTEGRDSQLVSCGRPGQMHQIRICCPQGLHQVPDGTLGEIWAAGPSMAVGYWQHSEATAATFVTADGSRWLRTGDLGFLFQDQLYISGRLKDLIIMHGHNLYPQDIEKTLESALPFVRSGRVSVFPVSSAEGEGIGIAVEISVATQNTQSSTELAVQIRDVVVRHFMVCPELILLLGQGDLPKTSSGKLQRSACLPGFRVGKLVPHAVFYRQDLQPELVSSWQKPQHWDELTMAVAEVWQTVLAAPVSQDDADFFVLGGNSVTAAQVLSQLQSQLHCHLENTALFETRSLRAFCQLVRAAPPLQAASKLPALGLHEYPLSAQQLRMLFLWQLEPNSHAYHLGTNFVLTGDVQAHWLQLACDQVLQQQQVLRQQYFQHDSGEWYQRTIDSMLNWQQLDLTAHHNPQLAAQQWLAQFHQQPFQLTAGENFRCALVKTEAEKYVFALSLHHIASDAQSSEQLTADIAQHYIRLSRGEPLVLRPAEVCYGDYAAAQQRWLQGDAAQQQLQYWRSKLAAEGDVLLLPSKHQGQTAANQLGSCQTLLSSKQVSLLQHSAQQHDASLFMLLLSNLYLLFYRCSGRQQPRIGVPVALRRPQELAQVQGFYINTLVLTAQLSPEMTFSELLNMCRQNTLEAQLNQNYPFEKLVEVLNPVRQLGSTPLFQVMFNHLQQNRPAFSTLPGVSLQAQQNTQQQAQFDLSIDSVLTADGELRLQWQFNADLFDVAQIERLQQLYLHLLQQVVQQPATALGQFSLTAQQHELMQAGRGETLPPAPCWIQTIRQIASQSPQTTAVIFLDQPYSYLWLEETSNRLAHGLLARGLKPEQVVALCLTRTPMLLACVLACLKAGCVYLPLDRLLPAHKMLQMLTDSGCCLLLAESDIGAGFTGSKLSPAEILSAQPAHKQAPAQQIAPEQLAYLNYTSGSTGKSKGVAVSHQALAEYIRSARTFIQLQPQDVVLQFATVSFDAFVEQVFPTWASGATVLLREDDLWDPATLYQQARRHQVSVMDLSAAYWRALVSAWQTLAQRLPLQLPSLRQVHSGGEAMSAAAVQAWQQLGFADVTLLNTYGPTEAVVEVTTFDCREFKPAEAVPLGQPLQGRLLYVLDKHLQPVPAGMPGELYIGGSILARGYLADPAKTASCFVADPFAADGSRMYATGDQVYWQHNRLHYLGRQDHQVKIRGFRVELAEIEAQLSQQPEVQQAVVLTRDTAFGLELFACVATELAAQPEFAHELKQRLSRVLPHYMLPAQILLLPGLPLNSNGKLDRQQLSKLEWPSEAPTGQSVAVPVTGEHARRVMIAWQKQLKAEHIDVHANFFDVGGHSLLLMAVHTELQQHYPWLTLTDLFTYPTIAGLAQYLQQPRLQSLPISHITDHSLKKQAFSAMAAKRRTSREI